MTIEITKAAAILAAGGLVAFPTETVYGLGGDASNPEAVAKIFTAKGRPADHPLIIHVSDVAEMGNWAVNVPKAALKLAEAFWPGPLTIILQKQPHVLDLVTGGQNTIGLRIPRHPIATALLKAFGRGVAAPSANRFTHISPTSKAAVQEELAGKVDMILDGGNCEIGLESTIIDMSRDQPLILRPGMISVNAISELLGITIEARSNDQAVKAPGMHHLHYAPRTKTLLFTQNEIQQFIAKNPDANIALLLINDLSNTNANFHRVKMSSQPAIYAHDLYHTLRELDHGDYEYIVIETPPMLPEWSAILDRLMKASG